MYHFVLAITCADCGKQFSHYNPNSEKMEDNIPFLLDFNFKEGKINFVCPDCGKDNIVELISHGNYMKYNVLPKIKRG